MNPTASAAANPNAGVGCGVMGVVNVTPDSFSDGGKFAHVDAAVEVGRAMLAAGARIVDVGGESTRPGAAAVPDEEQIRRVVPVIEQLSPVGTVSVDTRSRVVARAAIAAGATIINDVSAELDDVAADMGAGWIAMHMQGSPETMQTAPRYDDVVSEVAEYLERVAVRAVNKGVKDLWVDPGFGFGKTPDQNIALLAATQRFSQMGYPVVIGTSRKSTLGVFGAVVAAGEDPANLDRWAGRPDAVTHRMPLSVASALWAAANGADLVRVHDVEVTLRALQVWRERADEVTALGTGASSASAAIVSLASVTGGSIETNKEGAVDG